MFVMNTSENKPNIKLLYETAVGCMERGIRVADMEEVRKLVYLSFESAERKIQEKYGILNPGSPVQVIKYLKSLMTDDDVYEVIEQACVQNGNWTSDKYAMIQLMLNGMSFGEDILIFRKVKSYKQAIDSLLKYANEERIVHPDVTLGVTNRVNYSEPALMNIPKKLLWHLIEPMNTGNVLVSVDIKNQEPWIMVNMLGIERYKKALAEEKNGMYELVFEDIFGRQPNKIERNEIKIAWNALTYGATKFGLPKICKNIDAEKVYNHFNSIPEYKNYKAECRKLAADGVKASYTLFGTKIVSTAAGNKLHRALMDVKIQGTGSDILALLVEHLYNEIERRRLNGKISLYYTRHDEFIIEVDAGYFVSEGAEKVYETLKDILSHKIDDWEPFKLEVGKVEAQSLTEYSEDDFIEE